MPGDKTAHIGSVKAVLSNVKLHFGLMVDELSVSGEGAKLNAEPFEISLEQPGTVTARLSEASLAAYLEREAPGNMRDFSVTLADGMIHVSATAVFIVPLRVSANCTLAIHEATQLWVELESVDVMGVGARTLVESQIAKINPLLDTTDLPLDIRLEEVHIENGSVLLNGLIDPTPRLKD